MIYFIILFIISIGALIDNRVIQKRALNRIFDFLLIFILIINGLRHEIGADWGLYLLRLNETKGESFQSIVGLNKDLFYYFINWLGANFFGGIYLVNFICSLIIIFCIRKYLYSIKYKWLGLLVLYPYYLVIVSNNYTRQAVSIAIFMFGISLLKKNMFIRFSAFNLLSTSFHFSSVINFIYPAIISLKRNKGVFIVTAIFASLFGIYFYQTRLSSLIEVYLLSTIYESKGVLIRLIFLLIPSVIFLIYAKAFSTSTEKKVYQLVSFGVIFLLIGYFIGVPTTLLDRIALYLIPINVLVFSNISLIMPRVKQKYFVGSLFNISLAFIYLSAWLIFSKHSPSFIPYKSIIFL